MRRLYSCQDCCTGNGCDCTPRERELLELLADLAMEGKILGLGDPVAEVNDQTGVLGRVRATLGSDFLDGRPTS